MLMIFRPTLQHFFILMEGVEPWGDPTDKRKPGDLHGIIFQNITIAASSIMDEPDVLWGMKDGRIYNLFFDNVEIDGERIGGIEHFYHNEYVNN